MEGELHAEGGVVHRNAEEQRRNRRRREEYHRGKVSKETQKNRIYREPTNLEASRGQKSMAEE